jgi:hypothetical protein
LIVEASDTTATRRETDFDWRCVVGSLDMSPADYADVGEMLGLPMSQTFFYGTVRDVDGNIWNPMRRFTAEGGPEKLLLQTNRERDSIGIHRAGRNSASCAAARRWLDGDEVRFEPGPDTAESPFEIRASAQRMTWIEQDVFELHGTAVPPGLHWHLPDRTQGMYYVSQIYEVEGEILGNEVRGFIPMDQLWMNGMIYRDDIFVGRRAEVIWYTWATRYEDGSFDGGHFLVGHRQLGFALLYDEQGKVFATTDVTGRVTLDGDGPWPAAIDIVAAGDEWEFVPDARGRMTDLMPIPNPQIEGRWRRKGDTRQPAHWTAWGEIAPGHGLQPVR